MSVRPPNLLKPKSPVETGASVLDGEIMAEMASSLGRAGRALEAALTKLESLSADPDRPEDVQQREAVLQDAATKAWALIIQYELCGLSSQKNLVQRYRIPTEIVARLGMAKR
ncbi:MAG: hypothetical protein NXI27_14620 [Alphaproteobacteria bacterium]|nr:hypothetical protein [Alphaproteobacteria bacterium]